MKRFAVLLCAAVLLLCLPTSCVEQRDGSSSGTIKADAMKDPYGVDTQEQAAALQHSGEVILYWDTVERSDRERDFEEYFKKYFGGTVTYRFCPLDDDAATLIRDQAADAAPDVFRLTESYWPRAAMRNLTYSQNEIRRLGVVGVDHPALMRYQDMTEAAYTFNGACFALSVCYASPVMVAVNTDLFRAYGVATPDTYYAQGTWSNETFQRCCYELSRTAPGGQTVLGAVVRDPLWFLQADDADPMTLNGAVLKGDLLSSRALHTLAFCRGLLTSSAIGSDAKAFRDGCAGMLCDTADELAELLSGCAFDWDIVPFPYGGNNETGARPGTFIGWALPSGAKNAQGAVNFVIARQLFLDFHYNVEKAALWDADYVVYSEAQRRSVTDAARMVRPALFPHFGTLPDEVDGFWEAIRGSEPIYDIADRYTALIRAAISGELHAAIP